LKLKHLIRSMPAGDFPMKAVLGSIAIGTGACLLVLFACRTYIAQHLHLIAEEVPRKEQVAVLDHLRQHKTASFVLSFVKTRIEVDYSSPILADRSAEIKATVSQTQVFMQNPGFGQSDTLPDPIEFHELEWPITLTLRSGAFNFVTGEGEKKLASGIHLPISVVWAPIAKAPGDWNFVLTLYNVNGGQSQRDGFVELGNSDSVLVNLNGSKKVFGVNDEIQLPISVYTSLGVPGRTYEALTLGGAIFSFIVGSELLLGLFSRIWARVTGKKTQIKSKKRHKNHKANY
jgi:hypothetical protein